jgi:splicing factor 3A subunit 1
MQKIGLIIPPPEIKRLADMTAQYVATHGHHYEPLILEKEGKDPKFFFLKH